VYVNGKFFFFFSSYALLSLPFFFSCVCRMLKFFLLFFYFIAFTCIYCLSLVSEKYTKNFSKNFHITKSFINEFLFFDSTYISFVFQASRQEGCAPCRGSGFGRVPLAHIPIAHIHSHRPVLRVFLLDHQSENFILN